MSVVSQTTALIGETHCVIIFFIVGSLSQMSKEESLSITLKVLDSDILTVSPIKVRPRPIPSHFKNKEQLSETHTVPSRGPCNDITYSVTRFLVQVYNGNVEFAPTGLMNMYNSGGAVEAVNSRGEGGGGYQTEVHVKGRGSGVFGAFSSKRPRTCSVNSEEQSFEYKEKEGGLLTLEIPAETNSWDVIISY